VEDNVNHGTALNAPGRFFEVYCKCSLTTCEQRDPKGLYRRARKGEVQGFTGVSAPYGEPEDPEIVVETDEHSLEDCVSNVLGYLEKQGIDYAALPTPEIVASYNTCDRRKAALLHITC